MTEATRDPWIVEALRAGTVTTDLNAGVVFRDGRPAGTISSQGYLLVYLGQRRSVFAHRIIWIAANGQPDDPALQINHRNRVRHDNRLANLELVTAAENSGHAAGNWYYNRVRPEDEAAVAPEWLERVWAIAARGHITTEELAELRGHDIRDGEMTYRPYALPRTHLSGRRGSLR